MNGGGRISPAATLTAFPNSINPKQSHIRLNPLHKSDNVFRDKGCPERLDKRKIQNHEQYHKNPLR